MTLVCHRLFNIMKKLSFYRVIRVLIALLLIIALLSAGAVALVYARAKENIDFEYDEQLFLSAKGSKTTRFYCDVTAGADPDGIYRAKELEDERVYNSENSVWVNLSQIPKNLSNAFIAIEDRHFYRHSGVDFLRTAKAALNHIFHFDSRFGASTITQQLIKNISSDRDISVNRKVNEIIRALALEKNHTKDEILELYLNIVPMSQGCVGVASAAKQYFGKDVSELTLGECASLAAVTNSPAKYDPVRKPENNKERRDIILSQMLKYEYINETEYKSAFAEPIVTVKSEKKSNGTVNSWYIDMVIEDVIGDLMSEKGMSYELASRLVYSGGLKIYTLMNENVQSTLEEYFENEKNFPEASANQGLKYAMIVTDPNNGAVLGVVGSQGEKGANRVLNFATKAKRPIGSAIKPLSLYAPAIEENLITWGTVFDDVPLKFYENGGEFRPWPQNSPAVYSGLTDVATALTHSKNTVALRVYDLLGAEKCYGYLTHGLGFTSLVRVGEDRKGNMLTDLSAAPLAFGQLTHGATLRETTAAYDSLYEGVHHKSRSYLAVYDNSGELLLHNTDDKNRVFSPETAAIVTKMLENVVLSGTAHDITLKNIVDTAGKTGTSGGSYDKYFIGYTPYMCAGIWCGYEESDRGIVTSSHLRVWDAVMKSLHKEYTGYDGEPKSFAVASGVKICKYCKDSGLLIDEACGLDPRGSREAYGYFKLGTEPTDICHTHVEVEYDMRLGGVAGPMTLDEDRALVSLIRVESRDFPTQIYVDDAEYVYRPIGDGEWCHDPTLPYFYLTIPAGRYVGISKTADGIQFNRTATMDILNVSGR